MIILNDDYYVYIHTNKINGKMYIGVSKKKNPNSRWKNGEGYSYNKHFYSAIQKYGWDGFDHEIFAANLTKDEASNMEKLLIEQFNTTNRDYGYNFAEGGYNNRGLKGELNPFYKKAPRKAIDASRAARKGKPMPEEWRKHIKESLKKAAIHPNSLKALQEMDRSTFNHPKGKDNHKSQAVKCIETGIVYESQRIAEHELNLSRGSIYQALKNNIRAGEYHWIRVLNSNDQSKDVGSSEPKRRDANIA